MRRFVLLLVFCYSVTCVAQGQKTSPVTYRNLVMEGGGIRGIAYGGALAELEKQGVLAGIQRVGGTSAGAIQAALLAVGYSPQEIIEVINNMPVQRLNDGRLIFFGGSTRLLKQYGWYRGDQFTKYLSDLVARKTQNPDLTLGQLHTLVQQGKGRDLYVTGTNLTTQRTDVFSYETHPTLRVADAVRISMSIPLYFRAVLLDEQGNVVRKPAKGQKVNVLVDGGLLANYPLNLFDHAQYLPPNSVPTLAGGHFINPETLGLRLDRAEQIAYDTLPDGRRQLAPYDIHDFGSYMGAFYTLAIENLNATAATDWPRTISINTLGFNPKIKQVSATQKQALMDSGRQGVQDFFIRTQAKK